MIKNMNLNDIEPTTPTEAALLAYARFLERRVAHAEDHMSASDLITTRGVEFSTHSEIEQDFLRGKAILKVNRAGCGYYRPGFELRVESGPLKKDPAKRYSAAVFVSDMDLRTNDVLNVVAELYREGLLQIASTFDEKVKV